MADVSSIAYDTLKMAVEHVLDKIKEGKKLSTEDVLVLYLSTIVSDPREVRADIARLDSRIDETNKRIDQTNQRIDDTVRSLSTRIDEIAKSLSARIDNTNKRIDDLARSLTAQIAETNRRIDVSGHVLSWKSHQPRCFTPTHFSFDTDEMSAPPWLIEPRVSAPRRRLCVIHISPDFAG